MKIAALLMMVCLLPACSSIADVVEARSRGEGDARVYDVAQEQAWDVGRTVFRWNGADAIEEHKSEGYMLTSTGAGMMSWGTVMGAWFEPDAPGRTKVTVLTRRRMSTNLVTDLSESGFHDDFATLVPVVKAGKPLPLTRAAMTPKPEDGRRKDSQTEVR